MINLYDEINLSGLVYIRTWRLVNVRIGQDEDIKMCQYDLTQL